MNNHKFLLLDPEELPVSNNFDSSTKERLHNILNMAKIALGQKSYSSSIEILERAINLLNLDPETEDDYHITSKISTLKAWEIQDYDTFFGIIRVKSSSPVEYSILSLLVSSQNFLHMLQKTSPDNLHAIEHQMTGFISHINLMIRVLDIPLEETHEFH